MDIQLGKLITTDAQRDAIHVAIAPVVAAEVLRPAQPIGFVEGGGVGICKSPIGIVDPYLTATVLKGESFWMFLYPNTVTGMRHEWQHPAFADKPQPHREESESRRWLELFAQRLRLDADTLIHAASDYLASGECLFGGSNLEGEDIPDEFWDHYEAVTGTRVLNQDRGYFFRCAC